MKILVTGGAGFLGSHNAAYFLKAGHEVHIADRFSYAGKMRNIAEIIPDTKLWSGDLTNPSFCQRLLDYGFDVVVHCAANTDVDMSIKNPIDFTFDNVLAANRLLFAALRSWHPPKKIVIYSTDEVYGPTPDGAEFDEHTEFNPSNAYSASKVGVEGVARAYFVTHGMPIVVVRPCNTYGPRQHGGKIIPHFVDLCMEGKPLTVFEDGKGRRDWLHHLDHSRGIETLIRCGADGEAYNMPAREEHSCGEIAERISDILGVEKKIEYVNVRPGHDKRYWMTTEKIRDLGWTPIESFEQQLRATVLWFKDHRDWWKHDYLEARECLSKKGSSSLEAREAALTR